MNTKSIQEQIANLKSADIAAYKAGTKSNFVLNFVRNELITRAAKVDPSLATPIQVEVSMTVASYIAPSLALLSKDGNYERLFETAEMKFDNGNIYFTCKINGAGLSDEYRVKLNEQLGIHLPVATDAVV